MTTTGDPESTHTLDGADLRSAAAAFVVLPPDFDGDVVTLRYRFEAADGAVLHTFAEEVAFPPSSRGWNGDLVAVLAVAAGTSYFKAAAPPVVRVVAPVPQSTEALLGQLYDHGLREYAVSNDLPVPLDVRFEVTRRAPEGRAVEGSGALVPVGGGKDSALVMSVFGDATPFAIGPPVPSVRVAEAAGHELLVVHRRIDPALRGLNDTGALNGHIPVTAITSAVSALVAWRAGLRDVLMGNERSASEPTRWVGTEPVNHQHSKSFVFETALATAIADSTSGTMRYFSVLRPFSELAIARGLVVDDAMFGSFLSCNRAFTIWRDTEQRRLSTWCRDCPKCRFTALMLAPFVSPERLSAAMGGNMFDDPQQVDGFGELWDRDAKPFECVGEMVESAVAMAALADMSAWSTYPVVAAVGASARAFAASNGATLADVLAPAAEHRVPVDYLDPISARLAP